MESFFGRVAAAVSAALTVSAGAVADVGPEAFFIMTPDLTGVLGHGKLDGDNLEFRLARRAGGACAKVIVVDDDGGTRVYDATVGKDGSVFLRLFDGVYPLRMVLGRAGINLSLRLVDGDVADARLASAAAHHVSVARTRVQAARAAHASSPSDVMAPPRPAGPPTLWA